MTKEITQEERLDLTDKQVREEMQAYNSDFSDWCQLFGFDSKKVMEKYYHDIAINSDEYKKLKEENQRLKKQLKDYEKALKDYAECEPIEIKRKYWNGEKSSINCTMADIGVSARKILKKWEVK